MRWSDLEPDPALVFALEHAGARPNDGSQNKKRRWSERFAGACAVAFGQELRKSSKLKGKSIAPLDIGQGTESLVPLGRGSSKKIDVIVVDQVMGLEVGVSLKGLNFRDGKSNNLDKNLTGRLYELGDEVRLVHEHLPHAFMTGVFFLPLDAATDKSEQADSSFARTVLKLRERTGRLDAALAGHAARCDSAYVALYSTGEEAGGFRPGLLRFVNVSTMAPPRRGRPQVALSMSLREVVAEIVAHATHSEKISWAEPEPD
jgi:hypothetical protein